MKIGLLTNVFRRQRPISRVVDAPLGVFTGLAGMAVIMLLLPLALVIWLSFFQSEIPSVPPSGYTLRWYGQALANQQFMGGFVTSIEIGLIATAIGLTLAIPASLMLRSGTLPFSGAIMQFLTSPMIVPAIVVGAGLYVTLIQVEIMSGLPLVGSTWGLVLGHVIITIPWSMRLIMANIVGVDRNVEEAATSLGATPLVTLRLVTIPLMWPGIVAAALFSFVVSFSNLEISLFLVGPGKTTLPIAILQYLEWRIDPSVAAISVVQIFAVVGSLLLTDRFVPLTKGV